MPRKLQVDAIEAELSSIEDLISQSKRYGDPVGEMQYEYKKTSLKGELALLENESRTKASVALFFGGGPVLGSRGINADFAGKALNTFQDIVTKLFASLELGSLGQRGPVAYGQNSQLMITEVAKGSFGFVLDELGDQMLLAESGLKTVVDKTILLLDDMASSEQERFDAALTDIDSRTLISLKDFFKELDRGEATLRVVDDNAEHLFDQSAVHRARERTENTEINESTQIFSGKLIGLLPEHKNFEFKLEGSDEVIFGSVAPDALDHYKESLRQALNEASCQVEVAVRTVSPIGRPEKTTYKLIQFL